MPKRIKLQLDSSVDNVCYLCGVHLQDSKLRTDFSKTFDHAIPKEDNGKEMLPACSRCNTIKGTLWYNHLTHRIIYSTVWLERKFPKLRGSIKYTGSSIYLVSFKQMQIKLFTDLKAEILIPPKDEELIKHAQEYSKHFGKLFKQFTEFKDLYTTLN